MFKLVLLTIEDPLLYKYSRELWQWSLQTPGHINDDHLLKHFFLSSESGCHLASLIASDGTCKLLEGQLNQWRFIPWTKWKYVAGVRGLKEQHLTSDTLLYVGQPGGACKFSLDTAYFCSQPSTEIVGDP
jgi:hypothetical protein